MRLNNFFLMFLFSAVLGPAVAQNPEPVQKANWKQIEKFEKITKKFDNSLYATPRFINDTDKFWYCMVTSNGVTFYYGDPDCKIHRELFNMTSVLQQMSELTREAYTSMNFRHVSPKFDKSGTSFTFSVDSKDFKYNMNTGKVTLMPEEKQESLDLAPSGHMISPDSTLYIYAKQHNLYLYGNKDKGQDTTVVQLTTDGNKYRSYAKYPDESEQYDTYPAGRWLKNSEGFFLELEDETGVKDEMHVLDMINEPMPKLKSYRYCVPGTPYVSAYSFHILDHKTKKMTEVPTAQWKDQYVEYSHDNTDKTDEVFFYRYKRTWDEKELCAYNVKTGKTRMIINEVDKPYLDYVIQQTHYVNHAKEIILRSERTGWGHFYLYDGATGKYKRAITQGNFQTGQIVKLDTLKREIYFYGFGREKGYDPYYYVLYRAHLDRPGIDLLTPVNAQHNVSISPSSNYIIDTYSTVSQPHKTVVRNRNGKVIMELAQADLKPLFEAGWKAPERFCVKAADGVTDLYGVMWKPMDFDSTKTYPIISEVYPGPQFEYVPTSFGLDYQLGSALAQMGFIVIQCGHRGGTPLRGKAYHTYGYKKLRDYPLADDIAAIKELARRYPFINGKKAGMFGHSGGGFMSAAAICSSNFYSAAVACAGNHDNRIYNRGWVEMNNGIEEKVVKNKENPADSIQYKARPIHTNVDIAKNLKGHLLLVHGMMDDNVHPAHSFRLARKFMEAGLNFDMICLPKSTHGFSGCEDEYFLFKMRNHFAKYLLGDFSGEQILNWK